MLARMRLLTLLAWTAAALLIACSTPPAARPALGIQFVRIPAGEFMMGNDESAASLQRDFPIAPADDNGRRYTDLADEAPRHRVRITRDFEMAAHEVTVGQFRAFLAASGHVPESIADGTGGFGFNPAIAADRERKGDAFDGRNPRYSWADPGFPQGEDHPVTNVTFRDALAMAAWLGRQDGRTYRLPTEAEWEYACRAGSTGRFSNGDDPQALVQVGNLFDQDAARHWPKWAAEALQGRDGYDFTAPVGRFAPNAFGLYDLHGNVWEWTSDWYGEDWYAKSPVDDPQGPADGDVRVRRGGSWHTWPLYARCAYRNINTESTRYTLVGFRLVRELR
jgi:formylglycine-generating enzyme required for sulfatase activity